MLKSDQSSWKRFSQLFRNLVQVFLYLELKWTNQILYSIWHSGGGEEERDTRLTLSILLQLLKTSVVQSFYNQNFLLFHSHQVIDKQRNTNREFTKPGPLLTINTNIFLRTIYKIYMLIYILVYYTISIYKECCAWLVVVGVGPICHCLLLTRQESRLSSAGKVWLCGEFLSVGVRVSHHTT